MNKRIMNFGGNYSQHRFYGESIPNKEQGGHTTENLKYLTVEQALADLAAFTQWFSSQPEQAALKGAKWFVFGGSYPGALSAW